MCDDKCCDPSKNPRTVTNDARAAAAQLQKFAKINYGLAGVVSNNTYNTSQHQHQEWIQQLLTTSGRHKKLSVHQQTTSNQPHFSSPVTTLTNL